MKVTILFSLFPLIIFLGNIAGTSSRDANKDRVKRRKCESLCRAYTSVIEAQKAQGNKLDELSLKTTLEKTLKRLSLPASIFIPMFNKHMKEMETYLLKNENPKMMCYRLKVCRTLKNKRNRKQKVSVKRLDSKDSCKICTSVTTIIKATADLMNTTFDGMANIAKASCTMFVRKRDSLNECFKIISGIKTLESTLMVNLEAIKICEILGFCGNQTNSQSCAHEVGNISPWSTAMSLLKKGSSMVLTSKISTDNVLKGIKEEELFSRLAKCMEEITDEAENTSRRARRSLNKASCSICDRLREITSLQLKKALMGHTQGIEDVCKFVPSRKEKAMCRVISTLTSTLHTFGNAILPTPLCEDSICGKNDTENRTCEICKQVQVIISKDLKYAKVLFDMIVNQIQSICKALGSPKVQLECVKISILIDQVASSILNTFASDNFCRDFGLC